MKWQIVPESREEMIRAAYRGGRGGHRGSSAPSSPSQLSYITHGPGDVASREPGSRRKKLPTIGSPPPSSSLHLQSTPDRSTRHHMASALALTADGSPLPRPRKGVGSTTTSVPASSATYAGLQDQDSPTLTSSILQDEGGSFITPAPLRVHPRLAPPSTAQRPSQHMPTSSPAPFWKYADIGSTPLKPIGNFDISPSKPVRGLHLPLPPESSSPPPPAKSPVPSPTRKRESTREQTEEAQAPTPEPPDAEEEEGFDLAKYVHPTCLAAVHAYCTRDRLTRILQQGLPKYRILSCACQPRCPNSESIERGALVGWNSRAPCEFIRGLCTSYVLSASVMSQKIHGGIVC